MRWHSSLPAGQVQGRQGRGGAPSKSVSCGSSGMRMTPTCRSCRPRPVRSSTTPCMPAGPQVPPPTRAIPSCGQRGPKLAQHGKRAQHTARAPSTLSHQAGGGWWRLVEAGGVAAHGILRSWGAPADTRTNRAAPQGCGHGRAPEHVPGPCAFTRSGLDWMTAGTRVSWRYWFTS